MFLLRKGNYFFFSIALQDGFIIVLETSYVLAYLD